MPIVLHYHNLTNGLEMCGCTAKTRALFVPRVVRIQSTQLEQKNWAAVLDTLDANFLYHYARGCLIDVHDHSERERLTRALWQGLPWIKYACARTWYTDITDISEYPRSAPPRNARLLTKSGELGMDVAPYFEGRYRKLPRRTLHKLRYFRRYAVADAAQLRLWARDCRTQRSFQIP